MGGGTSEPLIIRPTGETSSDGFVIRYYLDKTLSEVVSAMQEGRPTFLQNTEDAPFGSVMQMAFVHSSGADYPIYIYPSLNFGGYDNSEIGVERNLETGIAKLYINQSGMN